MRPQQQTIDAAIDEIKGAVVKLKRLSGNLAHYRRVDAATADLLRYIGFQELRPTWLRLEGATLILQNVQRERQALAAKLKKMQAPADGPRDSVQ